MLVNAMTVDVEDYYQVSAFAKNIDKSEWDKYPSRVNTNTNWLLEHFDEHNIKATFFVLGWVAERENQLIKRISDLGHEVACHGYRHDLIYNQTKQVFKEETIKSKSILEDLIGKPVNGYRAASYSITADSIWAIDILCEAGFTYDSSIFPIVHDRYGIPNAETVPHKYCTDSGNEIIEFPLSTVGIGNKRLPISGGGYFRLFPYWMTLQGLRMVNKKNIPFIFYMHPWEIDVDQPRIKSSLLSEFRHYQNLNKFKPRLTRLINQFEFSTVEEVLYKYGLLSKG
ncbi:MAG: XrtA system polysaccharide deacetylase [Candidatus Thiodiazotropha endolucinida]